MLCTSIQYASWIKMCVLNISSLCKNILHVKDSHNFCATDIILLAEIMLIPNDINNEYLIWQYDIPDQNDQILDTSTRPSHGMICYVKIPGRVMENTSSQIHILKPFYYVCNIQYYLYGYR